MDETRYNLKSRFWRSCRGGAGSGSHAENQGFGTGVGAGVRWRPGWRGATGLGSRADSVAQARPLRARRCAPQKAEPAHGLKAGQMVFHNKFGEGKVLAIEGTGDDARAQVDFPRHGVKWLALSVAKLTPI